MSTILLLSTEHPRDLRQRIRIVGDSEKNPLVDVKVREHHCRAVGKGGEVSFER